MPAQHNANNKAVLSPSHNIPMPTSDTIEHSPPPDIPYYHSDTRERRRGTTLSICERLLSALHRNHHVGKARRMLEGRSLEDIKILPSTPRTTARPFFWRICLHTRAEVVTEVPHGTDDELRNGEHTVKNKDGDYDGRVVLLDYSKMEPRFREMVLKAELCDRWEVETNPVRKERLARGIFPKD